MTLDWGVTNQGVGTALGSWGDTVYFSTSPIWDSSAVSLVGNYWPAPLAAGSSYRQTNTVRLPVIESGAYYLFLRTDTYDYVYESDESNNLLAVPITFNAQPPDLLPVALQAPDSVTAPPYPTVTVVWGVTNQGTGEALGNYSWPDQLYLSTNMSAKGAALVSSGSESGPVPPGGSYWRTNSVQLPVVKSGTYYLIFKTDTDDSLFESNTSNNTVVAPIELTITPSDLAPLAFQIPAVVNGPPYPTVTLVWGGTNQGIGAALDGWLNRVYVSTNPVLDFSATYLAEEYRYGPVLPGSAYRQTNIVRLPLVDSGNYYFLFQTDAGHNLYESNEDNNLLIVSLTFNARPPDLAPVALRAPSTVTAPPCPDVAVVWGITNRGTGEARGNYSWPDLLYLSASNSPGGGTLVSSRDEAGPVAAGGSYWRTNLVRLPVVQSGTYYLVFNADADNSLRESDTNNNTAVVPIAIIITPADLAPVVFQAPNVINGPPHPQVTLVWGTTNQGVGAALGNWNDEIFLSTNSFLDSSATWVQWNSLTGPLPPASTHLQTNIVRLPVTQSGNYYLLFQSDANNNIYESNENNNLLAVPVAFNAQPPDLAPVALQAPAALTEVPYPTINIVWGVTNQGAGEALGYSYPYYSWYDALYVSTSNSPDGGTLLRSQNETGPVPAAGSYWRTNSVQLPVTQSGVYYLVFRTDINDDLLEADTNNNVMVVPITLTITPPDLASVVFQAPSVVTAPPLPSVTFSWAVTNQGSGLAKPYWTDDILLSTNPVFDSSATMVGYFYEQEPVTPGTVYWRTNNVNLPITQSGTYYVFFEADADDSLHESNRSNNVAVAQVTFNIRPADLTPSAFPMPSLISGPPNPKLLFSWAVTNAGAGAALGQWFDQIYFSTHPVLDWTASSLFTSDESGPVPPGRSYTRSRSATVPVTQSGQYYFIFQTDGANSLYESNTVNNIVVTPVTFQVNPPDLAPVLLLAPGVVTGPHHPSVTLTYGVTNQGAGPAMGTDYPYNWYDQLFVSSNPVLDGSEIPLGSYNGWSESGPVAPARSYWRTRTVQVPVMASGDYYLILRANARDTLFESNFTNNVMSVPVTFNIQPADLAPIALVTLSLVKGPPSPGITLAWGITNRGSGRALGHSYWVDRVYLSTDTNLDWPGTQMDTSYVTGPVPAGGSYWRTNFLSLPVSQSGTYYLVLKTDDQDDLLEFDENNNVVIAPVTFQLSLSDLAPLALQAPGVLTNSAYQLVRLVTGVTNQGPGSAEASSRGGWGDYIILSKNPVVDGTETFVSYLGETGPVPVGGSYWRTNTVSLPLLETGDYFLIFAVNYYQALAESSFTNNTLAVPLSFHRVSPDLAPVALQAPGVVDGSPNPSVTLVWGVTNQGPGQAGGRGFGWGDAVYLSTNSDLSGVIAYVSQWFETNCIPDGGSYWQTNTVRVPVTADGSYYLVFESDTGNYLRESNLSNNVMSVPVSFRIHLPDLAPVALQAPADVVGPPNPVLSLVWGVTNRGAGAAQSDYYWYDTIYLSTDAVLDDSAMWVWGALETNSIPAGGCYWRTNEVSIPVVQSGTYYLLFLANSGDWLQESDYSNNGLVTPVTFTIRPPDLAPVALLVPNTINGTPWPSVTVVVGVTNQGVGPAAGNPGWEDGIYLSTSPFLDQLSYPFVSWPRTNALPPGSTYWITNTLRLPVVDSATWYLIFKADAFDSLYESNEQNNSALAGITFELSPTPNLVPVELDVPSVVIEPAERTVTLAWHAANQGLGPLAGQWSDTVYFSSSPSLDWMAQPVVTALITNSLPPGAGYWQTNSVTLHGLQSGRYFFLLAANSDSGLFETDTDDNILSVPVRFDLSVPPALVIAGGQFLPNGAFQLAVFGTLGSQYILQASTNLFNWVAISSFTVVAAPTYITDPQARALQQRFYRVATVPAPSLPPVLTIRRTATNSVIISWPSPSTGWVLWQNTNLNTVNWSEVLTTPGDHGNTKSVTLAPLVGNRFYRLKQP